MIQVSEYSKLSWGFPSGEIDPRKKKDKEYCLAFSKAFYSMYLRNEFSITFQERGEMQINRLYGVSNQSVNIAKKMCYGVDGTGEKMNEGWMNINWAILPIAVKFRNAFLGMFTDIDFEILCESQDLLSKKEKEDKAWGLYAQKKLRPILAQQMGVELPPSEIPEPDSVQELLIYEQLGVYKNKYELAAEKFLRETFNTFSNWDLETKRMVLEDIWDTGKAVVHDCLDYKTQKIKAEYCDVIYSIIRKDNEGRILDGGVIKIKSIADVRIESELSGHPIDEDDLIKAGQATVGTLGNQSFWSFDREGPLQNDGLNRFLYDNWKVAVLVCEYRTADTKFYIKKGKEGEEKYLEGKFGENYKKDGNYKTPKTTITKDKINYYRATWLIGTDHIYNFGQQYDIPRPDKAEALSSFHYIKIPGFSPVRNMRPILDQVQLAWVKFQNAWAKAKPDGWMYDESVLMNSTLGSKLTADELVRMSEQTGRLFIKSTDKWKNPSMSPNAGLPIMSIPGGIGNALNEFVATWNLSLNMLQEITGLTPQASASPLPADTGKAVSEIQLASTTNILKPIINEYKRLKKSIAKTMLLRAMLTFKYSEKIAKDYYDVLGEETVEILKLASKSAAQLGINLVPKTSYEIKQDLKNAALQAMASGRNGVPQLTLPEFNMINMMVDSSASPKYIQAIMSKMINERMAQEEQNKQALIQEQAKGNMQATMAATEGAKEVRSFETGEAMKKVAFETMMELIKEKAKLENALELNAGMALVEKTLLEFAPPPQQQPQQPPM